MRLVSLTPGMLALTVLKWGLTFVMVAIFPAAMVAILYMLLS
jgi:hypothetical protein